MQIPPIGRLENYLIPVGLDLGARHHADPNEPVRRQVLLAGEVVELRGWQNAISPSCGWAVADAHRAPTSI